MRRRLFVPIVVAGIAGSGCFSYQSVPRELPLPDRGASVRAHLSEPGRFRLFDVTAENVVRVDGEVVGWSTDSLIMSAWWLQSGSGLEHKGVGETVALNRSALTAVERKRFSVARSGALVGVIALLSVLAGATVEAVGAGSSNPPGPVPPSR